MSRITLSVVEIVRDKDVGTNLEFRLTIVNNSIILNFSGICLAKNVPCRRHFFCESGRVWMYI